MVRQALVTAIVVLGAWSPNRPARVAGQTSQTPFRAGTDVVRLAVSVIGRDDASLTDLHVEDFEIREEGRLQAIRYFSRGQEGDAATALHVGLMLDTSGSMGRDIDLARSAAVRFFNRLDEAVDLTLVDFDDQVRLATFDPRDRPRLVERIRSRAPSGLTALYDALGVYLDASSEQQGRTVLVVFTDGGDTRSAIDFDDVLTLLRASTVTVFAVGFVEHQPADTRLEQRARLARLAQESGGEAFFPSSMAQVETAYDRVLAEIRSQYVLGYVSTNPARDGAWRKVEIAVREHDGRRPRVRARRGYFAPFTPGR